MDLVISILSLPSMTNAYATPMYSMDTYSLGRNVKQSCSTISSGE
ncbi:hypothetical protein ALPO108162_05110 [Alicyclobacillus pomorum]